MHGAALHLAVVGVVQPAAVNREHAIGFEGVGGALFIVLQDLVVAAADGHMPPGAGIYLIQMHFAGIGGDGGVLR